MSGVSEESEERVRREERRVRSEEGREKGVRREESKESEWSE